MDTTTADPQADADRALKAKHRAVWALGDYAVVARELIPDLGRVVVAAAQVQPGDRVLDVASGTGNAALKAAHVGASVISSDLTPELLDVGREEAEKEGVDLTFEIADAEALPYPDASFDVVLSCVGVMFAPHHAKAAHELTRVLRPGGRLALINWTPRGFIGQLFQTLRPFVPSPPEGVQPPPLWGDEGHVRELLDGRVTGLSLERGRLHVDRFGTAEEFRDFFRDLYGPTAAAYRSAQEHGLVDQLDTAMLHLADSHLESGAMDWEYLLVAARGV